jgi:hypothetical protein
MALAGGCIAGILWKTGAGSIATAGAIAGFAAGELLVRWPFAPALDGSTARRGVAVLPPHSTLRSGSHTHRSPPPSACSA